MTFEMVGSINNIPKGQWDSLWRSDYPFIQHDFLRILEQTQCTNKHTGWEVSHCIAMDRGELVAAMPLYIKTHSYGEYVFDWAWADAYQRAGFPYYPKLICAIPFTPCTGPRIAATGPQWRESLLNYVLQHSQDNGFSSFHCLFPSADAAPPKTTFARLGCQFHWHNKNYGCFADFLQNLSSRKRKNINKERQKISTQNISVERKLGGDLTSADWHSFYEFYQTTYLKKSGHEGYLSEGFFVAIGADMADNTLLVRAKVDQRVIAQALYFYDSNTLYGRYWGALESFDALHYECCYYQGIEFAIEKKLNRFDAGAQGEHKIARGFTPMLTQSNHYISHPEFARAIDQHLAHENKAVTAYCNSAREASPYKDEHPLPAVNRLIVENKD